MNYLKGMDISRWQGDIDFSKVANDGIGFAIIRSSFRHTTDPKFFEYVDGCKANGIDILGTYHFSYATNVSQAISEAKYAVERAKEARLDPEKTFIFFDFEHDTVIKAYDKSGIILLPSACNAHAIAFCDYVKKAGYIPGIYCNLDYYENAYTKDTLSRYFVWLADYSGEAKYACNVHQYTDKGKVAGITSKVDLDYYFYSEENMESQQNLPSRQTYLNRLRSWIGYSESNGKYKKIIDSYNSLPLSELPRKIKMEYNWPWCAVTVSAAAIELGYKDFFPIEMSCAEIIKKATEMGIWVEDDNYVPQPGDWILYDWDDNGKGDNMGVPDHVGCVEQIEAPSMVVIEGNYDDAVRRRNVIVGQKNIRGYVTPNYADGCLVAPGPIDESDLYDLAARVIGGEFGNGEDRKQALGDNYEKVQKIVNYLLSGKQGDDCNFNQPTSGKYITDVGAASFNKRLAGEYLTTANVNLRRGAGTSTKSYVVLKKNSVVKCYGYYTKNGVNWLLVAAKADGYYYEGYVCSSYLKAR